MSARKTTQPMSWRVMRNFELYDRLREPVPDETRLILDNLVKYPVRNDVRNMSWFAAPVTHRRIFVPYSPREVIPSLLQELIS